MTLIASLQHHPPQSSTSGAPCSPKPTILLPPEVWAVIFSFLTPPEIIQFAHIQSSSAEAARSTELWKHFVLQWTCWHRSTFVWASAWQKALSDEEDASCGGAHEVPDAAPAWGLCFAADHDDTDAPIATHDELICKCLFSAEEKLQRRPSADGSAYSTRTGSMDSIATLDETAGRQPTFRPQNPVLEGILLRQRSNRAVVERYTPLLSVLTEKLGVRRWLQNARRQATQNYEYIDYRRLFWTGLHRKKLRCRDDPQRPMAAAAHTAPSCFPIGNCRVIWRVPLEQLIEEKEIMLERTFYCERPDSSDDDEREATDALPRETVEAPQFAHLRNAEHSTTQSKRRNLDPVVVRLKLRLSKRFADDWNVEFWARKLFPLSQPFGGFQVKLLPPKQFSKVATTRSFSPVLTPPTKNSTEEAISRLLKRSSINSSVPSASLTTPRSENDPPPPPLSEEEFVPHPSVADAGGNEGPTGFHGINIRRRESRDAVRVADDASREMSSSSGSLPHLPAASFRTPVVPPPDSAILLPPLSHQVPPATKPLTRNVWVMEGFEWGWGSFLPTQDQLMAYLCDGHLFFDIKWFHRSNAVKKCVEKRVCTFRVTGPCFTVQKWFHCLSCGLSNTRGEATQVHRGCCEACALVCHKGHTIVPIGWTVCYCDCGANANVVLDD